MSVIIIVLGYIILSLWTPRFKADLDTKNESKFECWTWLLATFSYWSFVLYAFGLEVVRLFE